MDDRKLSIMQVFPDPSTGYSNVVNTLVPASLVLEKACKCKLNGISECASPAKTWLKSGIAIALMHECMSH